MLYTMYYKLAFDQKCLFFLSEVTNEPFFLQEEDTTSETEGKLALTPHSIIY